MGRGRPGGNPELKKHAYKTERPEPLKSKLAIWIEPSLVEALKEKENWRDLVRKAIAEIIDEEEGKLSEELREFYKLKTP